MHVNLQSPYLNEAVKALFWLTFLVCNFLKVDFGAGFLCIIGDFLVIGLPAKESPTPATSQKTEAQTQKNLRFISSHLLSFKPYVPNRPSHFTARIVVKGD